MDAMIDLETLGTTPGCFILSVGAVAFDPLNAIMDENRTFYCKVSMDFNSYGLTIDPKTVKWWLGRDEDARMEFVDDKEALPLLDVMREFHHWYREMSCSKIWSHGASFDVPIWEEASRRVGLIVPWHHRDIRDTRTIFDLIDIVVQHRAGVKHHALDDAIAQAEAIIRGYVQLGLRIGRK